MATCGREPLFELPPRPEFGPNPVAAFTATDGPGGIALKLSRSKTPVKDIMVFASPPCNAGRSYSAILIMAKVQGKQLVSEPKL